jgi:hypothetical protein
MRRGWKPRLVRGSLIFFFCPSLSGVFGNTTFPAILCPKRKRWVISLI